MCCRVCCIGRVLPEPSRTGWSIRPWRTGLGQASPPVRNSGDLSEFRRLGRVSGEFSKCRRVRFPAVDSEEGCMAPFAQVPCFLPVVPRMTSCSPDLFQLIEYLYQPNDNFTLNQKNKMTILPSIKKARILTRMLKWKQQFQHGETPQGEQKLQKTMAAIGFGKRKKGINAILRVSDKKFKPQGPLRYKGTKRATFSKPQGPIVKLGLKK
ncbi:hypothetical protein LXL04_026738 [Taraxacum kok-saghyz]